MQQCLQMRVGIQVKRIQWFQNETIYSQKWFHYLEKDIRRSLMTWPRHLRLNSVAKVLALVARIAKRRMKRFRQSNLFELNLQEIVEGFLGGKWCKKLFSLVIMWRKFFTITGVRRNGLSKHAFCALFSLNPELSSNLFKTFQFSNEGYLKIMASKL